jgi:hypothetical protein
VDYAHSKHIVHRYAVACRVGPASIQHLIHASSSRPSWLQLLCRLNRGQGPADKSCTLTHLPHQSTAHSQIIKQGSV